MDFHRTRPVIWWTLGVTSLKTACHSSIKPEGTIIFSSRRTYKSSYPLQNHHRHIIALKRGRDTGILVLKGHCWRRLALKIKFNGQFGLRPKGQEDCRPSKPSIFYHTQSAIVNKKAPPQSLETMKQGSEITRYTRTGYAASARLTLPRGSVSICNQLRWSHSTNLVSVRQIAIL